MLTNNCVPNQKEFKDAHPTQKAERCDHTNPETYQIAMCVIFVRHDVDRLALTNVRASASRLTSFLSLL